MQSDPATSGLASVALIHERVLAFADEQWLDLAGATLEKDIDPATWRRGLSDAELSACSEELAFQMWEERVAGEAVRRFNLDQSDVAAVLDYNAFRREHFGNVQLIPLLKNLSLAFGLLAFVLPESLFAAGNLLVVYHVASFVILVGFLGFVSAGLWLSLASTSSRERTRIARTRRLLWLAQIRLGRATDTSS